MLKIVIIIFFICTTSWNCCAAAPDAFRTFTDRANELNEQRLRLLEEEQRRSLLTPPEKQETTAGPAQPSGDAGPCVAVNTIRVEGASLLSSKRLGALIGPHEGKCLALSAINGILREITNAYAEKGYVTSRAVLEPQDLSSGILRIRVIEGRVESIEPDAESTMQARQFLTIFPFVRGSVLDLRDIEQGLDQLNRLPSNRAAMRIEPGNEPGTSKVLISNVQERTWRPFIGLDNLGQDATGRAQYTFGLEKDNFIGCNDQIALYATTNMPKLFDEYEKEWKEGYSSSVTGLLSIPFGYWLLSANASAFHYSMQIRGQEQNYTGTGDTVAARVALDRVLWRDANSKVSLGAFFQYRDVTNYFEEEKLRTSSYRLSTAGLALTYVRRMLGGALSLSLEQTWGLPAMSWAAYGTEASAMSPKTDFRKTSGSLYWQYPFEAFGQSFGWTLNARGQIADATLYGSERLYIGSFHTVRGFKDTAVGGDQGGYIRNELAWNVPQKWLPFEKHAASGAQLFAAYDHGGIITDYRDKFERGQVSGAALGLRTTGKLALEVAWSRPLEVPRFVRRAKQLDDVWYANIRYTF